MRKKLTKIIFMFIGVILIASFFRLYMLGEVPYGITNDEASYIYSAYSLWNTSQDVAGHYFYPLSFNLGSSLSPVPVYITAPFVGFFGLSSFSGRLPFALLGIGSVVLVYFIARKLFKNEIIAWFSAFVLAVSPWHLQISRAAYDGVIALFFFLLGTYLFIVTVKKGNIIWSLFAFFLAFYSYHGTKVFFIFYIPILLYIYRDELLKRKKELLLFVLGIFVILLSFVFVVKYQGVTRQDIFLFNETKIVKEEVDWERTKNIAPEWIKPIFSNKILYFARILRENYLEVFSTEFLFSKGDKVSIYGTGYRGVMYIIELPLIFMGVIYLFTSINKKVKYFVFLSLLAAPLPSLFTIDTNYVMRSIMMLPFLSMIVGVGVFSLWEKIRVKGRRYGFVFLFVFGGFYVFLILSYLYQYYYRYQSYAAENWLRSHREIISYIKNNSGIYENVYIHPPNNEFLLQYGVFNNVDPNKVRSAWKSSTKKIDNVTFLDSCIKAADSNSKVASLSAHSLYIAYESCPDLDDPKEKIYDYGEPIRVLWKIYENK